MGIAKYVEECYKYAKLSRKMPHKKVSFKFLYSNNKIRKYIVNFLRTIYIEYEVKEFKLNKEDKLTILMSVSIYPRAPFFSIEYCYNITLFNRKRFTLIHDELNIVGNSIQDISGICIKEKKYITDLLEDYKYKIINQECTEERIPLLSINSKVPSKYVLGCQPYLSRLLAFGVEYTNRYRRRLSVDMDSSLVDIGDELIYLAKHSKYINGEYIVGHVNKYFYEDASEFLESMCIEYGGKRLENKDNAYIWHIGDDYLDEGDVKISSSVYIYLSAYIKTFYVKVSSKVSVKNIAIPSFSINSNTLKGDIDILLGKIANMFYNSIEGLEALGYRRQKEVNYKLPIQIAETSESKQIEIGEILFGLKPDEYSYNDKIERL